MIVTRRLCVCLSVCLSVCVCVCMCNGCGMPLSLPLFSHFSISFFDFFLLPKVKLLFLIQLT
jgi:hypothetical protein